MYGSKPPKSPKTFVELERKREVPKVREIEEREGEDGGFVVVTRHEIIHEGTPPLSVCTYVRSLTVGANVIRRN